MEDFKPKFDDDGRMLDESGEVARGEFVHNAESAFNETARRAGGGVDLKEGWGDGLDIDTIKKIHRKIDEIDATLPEVHHKGDEGSVIRALEELKQEYGI